jgi:hypothetical protein
MRTAMATERWIPFAAVAAMEVVWLAFLGWLAWRG